ncbi:hypothetical protein AWB78_02416 [Caballeronia calidae]|uniref:Lipoprotein n=1 Tax=Caballeronia calidae TaxID=1777139 RepID=A0A158B8W3_9BURK|nr:hypothetical protein AWB78_02416 [Caballeronia calidae]
MKYFGLTVKKTLGTFTFALFVAATLTACGGDNSGSASPVDHSKSTTLSEG